MKIDRIDCPKCGYKKVIPEHQQAAFENKYVMDGSVMCLKCDHVYLFRKPGLKPISVAKPKSKPNPKTASVADKKTYSDEKLKEFTDFADSMQSLSSIIFVATVLAIVIPSAIAGMQTGDPLALFLAVLVSLVFSILPAYISASTFRFFAKTIRLLVEILKK